MGGIILQLEVNKMGFFGVFTGTIDHAAQIFYGRWRDRTRFLTFTDCMPHTFSV
jgi:hypothetical protein